MDAFSQDFRAGLHDLMRWRRDVRHFRKDPVDEAVLMRCLDAFSTAPSVGLSDVTRRIRQGSDNARAMALDNFQNANAQALNGYSGDQTGGVCRSDV